MIRPWTRNKTLILIITILSLAAIYFISSLYVISPLKTEAKNVESEVKVYKAQVEKIKNHETDAEHNNELNETILQIPDNKSSDDVLSTIQKISRETKVTVESISSLGSTVESEEEEEPSFSTRHLYSLEVTADKLNYINTFLDQLLLADRLLTIETLSVDQSMTDATASITFATYYTNN